MKLTKKLEAEILKAYHTLWDANLSGDIKTFASFLDNNITVYGTAAGEVFTTKKAAVKFYKSTADQMAGKADFRKRKIVIRAVGDTVVINEQCDLYVLIETAWIFYGHARITAIFEKKGNSWKVVHMHGSFPDSRTEEGEQLNTDKIKAENLQLRDAVKRRTIELEGKNRELEIEASLERIRAVAMAMHKSEDLLEVCEVMYKEFLSLGFDEMRNAIININNDTDNSFINYDYAETAGKSFNRFTNNVLPFVSKIIKTAKSADDAFSESYISGKALAEFKRLREQTRQKTDTRLNKATSLYFYFYSIGIGSIGISTFGPIDEDKKALLKRFRNVFNLSYQRYVDITKAEGQAREAQIEAALERVRARTMAMHKSSDLLEVVKILGEQFELLGFKFDSVNFNTDYKEKDFKLWLYNSGSAMYPGQIHIPYIDHPCFNRVHEVFQNGADFGSFVFTKEEKDSFFDHIYANSVAKYGSEERKKYTFAAPGMAMSVAVSKNTSVTVANYEGRPFSEDENAILRRFVKVFEQSYTRFLDLQKAEAQAREAQIETALERVRASSMAMHQSKDLLEVIKVVTEQLLSLGYKFNTANFAKVYGDGSWDLWLTTPEQKYPDLIHVPYFDHPVFNVLLDNIAKGVDSFTDAYEKKQAKKFFHHFFENTIARNAPESRKQFVLNSNGFARSLFLMKDLWLAISNYEGIPYTAEENQVFKRFAKVFEQAYTRFLDLQKAEAQTREAQIEAALERVRSRSMGMQKSDELAEVVAVLYKQFEELDFGLYQVLVSIYDKKNNIIEWWSKGFGDIELPQRNIIPIIDHPFNNDLFEKWENGVEYYPHVLEGALKESWDEYLFTKTDLKNFPQEVKDIMRGVDKVYLSDVFMKYGSLQAAGPAPLPDDKAAILKRFVKVLDLAYTRMKDLQTAELQAREAQIELGLERVRSRAMAMQTSEELNELIGTVFTELTKLDLALTRCVIWVFDPATNEPRWWMANGEDPSNPMNFLINYHEHPAYLTFIEEWKKQNVRFVYDLNGQDKISWDDILFNETELKNLPNVVKNGMRAPERVLLSASFNNFGGINAASLEPLSDEHFDILLRFARVFDLTYTRFNDLKQAEAQAREAQIQLGLERVRARTMAMQRSDELLGVVSTLYEQLNNLQFDSNACNIIIIDKESNNQRYWVSGFTQKLYPESYNVPYFKHPYIDDQLKAWKDGRNYIVIEYSGKMKQEFDKQFFSQTDFKNIPEEVKKIISALPSAKLSTAFFTYGALQMIGPNQLSEENAAILQRFAKVFDQTYTRFLDLQTAEAQTRESQIQLALERVRARTMAMQKSDELSETVFILLQQFRELGKDPEQMTIGIMNETERIFEMWLTLHGHRMDQMLKVTIDEPIVINKMYVGWKEQKRSIVIDISGDELVAYNNFRNSLTQIKVNNERTETRRVIAATFFSKGLLTISNDKPYSQETIEILERFASVFDLTYTRFLDLQKAEAQTRESQIQLALERVRARTMAMQKSDELPEASYLLFEQFKELGVEADQFSIGIINEEEGVGEMYATIHGTKLLQLRKIRIDEPIAFGKAYKAWKAKEKNLTLEITGQDLETYNIYRNKVIGKKIFSEEVKPGDRWIIQCAFFSKGILSFASSETVSEETLQLLERFAKVFDGTYTRFLDLKQAEAQAREAKIEAALERVRSRAMAMHKTNELLDAAELVYKELSSLGIASMNISYAFVDKEEKYGSYYSVNPIDSKIPTFPFVFPHTETRVMLSLLSSWKKQEPFNVIELNEEETVKHQTYIGEHIQQEFIKNKIDIPFSVETFVAISPKSAVIYSFNFKQGYLFIIGEDHLTTEQEQMILRFTKVFELAYRRFLDLQKAEAQTREAQIELALERVRARTMAMHRSEELAETAQVLFHQLQELGGAPDRISIGVVDETAGFVNFWTTDQLGSHIDKGFKARLDERISISKSYQAWKEQKKSLIIDMHGDDVREWLRFAREEMGITVKDEFIKDRRVHNLAFFSHGWILVTSHEPQSTETIQILERFASVFNLTYRRFLDLQKAEAQANEARIEIALERIRARALAMHKSDELIEVAKVLWEQMTLLGQRELEASAVHLYELDPDHIHSWRAVSIGPDANPELTYGHMAIPKNSCELVREWLEKFYSNSTEYTIELVGAKQDEWYDVLFKLAPDVANSMRQKDDVHEKRYYRFSKFSGGALLMISKQEPSDEVNYLQRRAAVVFDLAYRRFSDLQKAEAQAREAQIEAALERVRAKAMAMHKSEDLQAAVTIMFEEFQKLNLEVLRCGIGILDKDVRRGTMWATSVSDNGLAVQISANESFETHPLMKLIYDHWQKQEDLAYTLQGQDLVDYYRAMDTSQLKLPKSQLLFSEDTLAVQYYYGAMFNAGGLYAFSDKPFSAEDIKIMKRFASVVDLTYKRFFDLQKAEAQAKEAQIEAGLERVRARTMAMHTSDDVAAATATMFGELEKLGIQNLRGGITIIKPDQTQEVWSITNLKDGKTIRAIGVFDMRMHPLWQALFNAWKNEENYSYYRLAGKEKDDYVAILNATPNYLTQPITEIPDVHVQSYFFDEGAVWTNSLESHSDEDKQIVKRFASVFTLTFRRYQDLKKAEAQAREATIEAALERVRGKAMAMHSSKDLTETIGVFYHELEGLSLTPRRCGVGLINEKARTGELSTMSSTSDGQSIELIGTLDLTTHPILEGVYNNWVTRTEYHPVLRGNEIKEYYKVIRPQIAFPDYPNDSAQYGYFFFFDEGGVYAWTEKELQEDELKIYRRFTSVLSLTYKRYKDLKDAESRAQNAIKEAVLDRIRADIASMRTVEDLDRITPLIWNELTTLNIPFIRCGVFIMDEDQQLIHTFLSTPDGKAIAAFHLPYDTPGNISKVIDNWRHKKIYTDHWGEEEFIQFAEILMDQGALGSKEQYLKTIPHGGFYLHFLPFLQGMLYVGNTDKLNEEQVELIQHVADAFSTAYARYEDFNKLEAAKQQVERTLVELKQAQTQLVQSEKMASLGELTAGIAHEIQNPLNFVNNFSDVSNELLEEMKNELEKGNKEDAIAIVEDVRQNLEKILHHGKRADAIVKGMLQHSRTSSGQKEMVDINILADEYLRLAYHGLRAKDKSFNAKFETHFDNNIEKVSVIPQDFGRVILNLINNAFYTVAEKKKRSQNARPDDPVGRGYEPTVTVTTLKDNGRIEIKVQDNGNGISPKNLDKIFQPFFTTKPTGQGTGLGLSLAYDIITKGHGGELKVETKEGEGSSFSIILSQ